MQEKEECAPREKDWERRREGAGGHPGMWMLRLSAAECVCLYACVHKKECVRKKGKREQHLALPVRCVAILLANTPHPLSVLLSQDSDTQMLADASSQSS